MPYGPTAGNGGYKIAVRDFRMIEKNMTMQPEMNHNVWRILEIDHDKKMVVLVSSSSPTVKRFGVPNPIQWAEVIDQRLCVYCEDLVAWEIMITDGARRKLAHMDSC